MSTYNFYLSYFRNLIQNILSLFNFTAIFMLPQARTQEGWGGGLLIPEPWVTNKMSKFK